MSTSGLTNQYDPPTLDGLTILDADAIYINGQEVNLDALVPYSGATQTVDLGVFPLRTAYLAAGGSDVVNKDRLDLAINNVINSVGANFLSKTIGTDQTVASKVSFLTELVVSPQKRADLAEQVVVDASYQNLITSASVTVVQYFGSISNVGVVYQATCTNNIQPILTLASIVSGKRYRIQIETLIQDSTYDWSLDIYQSQNGIDPYPNFNDGLLDTNNFGPASALFQLSDVTFTALTTGTIALTILTTNPSGIGTVQWKNLKVFEMGASLQNVTMPSLTADRVMVLNEKKQLVSSGINTTKLGYLDNVSSDIQTQLNSKASTTYVDTQDNLRLLKAGDTMTGTLVMGSNKITTSYTPLNAEDLTRKGYVDSAISGATAGFVLKAGDTMTGTLFNNGGNFQAYRGGDLNKSCTLYANNADGASYATHNGGLASWNGIGFYCTLDSTARHVFNTRDGSSQQTGKLTCFGIDTTDTIQSGLASNTTASIKLANSLSHIDNAAGEVYLFTGFQGHMAIGRNTTRDATTANLCLGVANTDECQIISTKTNNTGYLPMTFASSRFVFSTGNVGIGNTEPRALIHLASTVANRKIILFATANDDHQFYGWGINDNTLRYQVDQSASSHVFYCGNGATSSLELARIDGTGQFGFTGGGTGYALSANLMTRRGAVCIGAIDVNYGGGWEAGLMLECQNTTEISCHDAGNRVTSFIYYDGGNRVFLGRDIGWGVTPFSFKGNVSIGGEADTNARLNIANPNGSYSHLGYSDNVNYIRGVRTQIDTPVTVSSGDNSKITFGPNGTWGAYLRVGSGTADFGNSIAQLISTNGNAHLDGGYSKDIYIGYYPYAYSVPNNIRLYGTTYFTGRIFAPVAAQINGGGNPNWGQVYTYDALLGDMVLGQCEYYHNGPYSLGFQGDWRGRNTTTQIYKKDSQSSMVMIGYATGYLASGAVQNINIDIRLYNQSTGQYFYGYTYFFANYGYTHINMAININWGVLPAGWYDVYTYTSTPTVCDANDWLSYTTFCLPNGCNR